MSFFHDTLRLVHNYVISYFIAENLNDFGGIPRKPIAYFPIQIPALFVKTTRQIPVKKRYPRRNICGYKSINEVFIELNAF